jgi:hypothetical protein
MAPRREKDRFWLYVKNGVTPQKISCLMASEHKKIELPPKLKVFQLQLQGV